MLDRDLCGSRSRAEAAADVHVMLLHCQKVVEMQRWHERVRLGVGGGLACLGRNLRLVHDDRVGFTLEATAPLLPPSIRGFWQRARTRTLPADWPSLLTPAERASLVEYEGELVSEEQARARVKQRRAAHIARFAGAQGTMHAVDAAPLRHRLLPADPAPADAPRTRHIRGCSELLDAGLGGLLESGARPNMDRVAAGCRQYLVPKCVIEPGTRLTHKYNLECASHQE